MRGAGRLCRHPGRGECSRRGSADGEERTPHSPAWKYGALLTIPSPPTQAYLPQELLQQPSSVVPLAAAALRRPLSLPGGLTVGHALGAAAAVAAAGAALAWLLVWRHRQPIYLLDFECYRPGAPLLLLGCR